MDVIQMIQQELSGGLLNRLSSVIGQGEMKTRTVAATAVPAILSAMGGLASTPDGAQRLAEMVRKFTPEEMANLNNMTGSQVDTVVDEGTNALVGMFDKTMLNGVLRRMESSTGLNDVTLKKLFGFLMTVVCGTMTKKFGTTGLTGSTMSAFFTEQKTNIANALPPGFSLTGIPNVPGTVAPSNSSGTWIALVLIILLLAGGAYWYFYIRPKQENQVNPEKPGKTAMVLPEVSAPKL